MSKSSSAQALPFATTNLDGFGGAAFHVSAAGGLVCLNDAADTLLAGLHESARREIVIAAGLAQAQETVRLERLNGPFPGDAADAVLMPLRERAGVLVLVATNPAEGALRRALIESRQRYRDLVEACSDFVWETDRHGRFTFLSAAGVLGYSTRDMLGRFAADFVIDASSVPYPVFQAREKVLNADVWLQRADGQLSCQLITAVPIFDADGLWCGARGMGRDVTAAREAERLQKQRLLRERLMTYLANTVRNEVDPEKTLPTALSGICLAIGASGGVILIGDLNLEGQESVTWGDFLPDADLREALAALQDGGSVDLLRGSLRLIGHVTTDDGAMADSATEMQPKINGAVLFWCSADRSGGGFDDGDRLIVREVAEQIAGAINRLEQYREIVTRSNTDSLTGLLNRSAFVTDLERRLRRLTTAGGQGTLCFLDLNNLKAQNDQGGHAAGDRALRKLGAILAQSTRPTDLVGRLGGDEFVVWLEGVGADTARTRAEYLIRQCDPLGALSVVPTRPLGVSMGVAIYDGAIAEPLDQLIARADIAMYDVKTKKTSGFSIADAASGETRAALYGDSLL
jgi:diguanylate cyclase (GGDEF)-like protein/PAS domain S-box-containing protein